MPATIESDPHASRSGLGATNLQPPSTTCGGIGRRVYIALAVVVSLAYKTATFSIPRSADSTTLVLLAVVIYLGVMLCLVWPRLVNIGDPAWWSLGAIVPFLNVYVIGRCLLCPTGYKEHKKLDLAGEVMLSLMVGAVLLLAVSLISMFATQ